MATDRKVFSMRLPPNDYAKLRALSAKNKRSMAAELEYILEQYFEKYELQNGQVFFDNGIKNHQIGNNNLFVNSNS